MFCSLGPYYQFLYSSMLCALHRISNSGVLLKNRSPLHRATPHGQGNEGISECRCVCYLNSPAMMYTEEGLCCPLRHNYLLIGLEVRSFINLTILPEFSFFQLFSLLLQLFFKWVISYSFSLLKTYGNLADSMPIFLTIFFVWVQIIKLEMSI